MKRKTRGAGRPRGIDLLYGPKGRVQIYADFDDHPDGENVVYIGGSYYHDSAQIHLNEKEVHALAAWLTKASAYLKQRKPK